MSYLYSVNKTGVGGVFFKILFLNGGVDVFLYFDGGWDLWLKKKKSLLSRMYIFLLGFSVCFVYFLESSTATHETMELKKPRDLNQLIVLFVNLYK